MSDAITTPSRRWTVADLEDVRDDANRDEGIAYEVTAGSRRF